MPVLTFAQKLTVFAGTYTGPGKGEGIYVFDLNLKTGAATGRSVTRDVVNPSFLAFSPDKNFLYGVNEAGDKSGASSFRFDRNTGKLIFLNKVASSGKDPCYIIADEKNVITANYSTGNINIFSRAADGTLGALKQVVQHTGSGKDLKRQAVPHAHSVQLSPDGKYLVAADLGSDKIYIHKYLPEAGEPLSGAAEIKMEPGTGPRHIIFSKNGNVLYVLGELDGQVHVFSFKNGKAIFLQKMRIAPASAGAAQWDAADLHLSPDGRFLYASLRATQNSISTFAVLFDGTLRYIERTNSKGEGPRNFMITPDGKWLLVANQKSNQVVIFKRIIMTGKLIDSGHRIEIGAPVCLIY